MKISLIQGDISQAEADALVNAANNELWMGSGVAGALRRAAGPEVEREAISKGPIKVGEAVATGAGQLAAHGVKYIIHAAAMGARARASERSVHEATLNSLREAERLAVKRIAFPALGAGVGGYDLRNCAKTMLGAVREYAAQYPASSIEEVIFVLRCDEAYRVFAAAMSD
ncbi:MAG: Appr-1-p processing protein [Candidatus Chloroheliales bacterium]|nr:MAG: Appr-1-p processing protein [Chloroflexota bacterium]